MENELICTPIMFNTETEGALVLARNGHIFVSKGNPLPAGWSYQHLYLTSSEDVTEEGEVFYFAEGVELAGGKKYYIGRAIRPYAERFDLYHLFHRKVIASTDKSLGLPLIPQSFIEEYVQKQGKIDKVKIRFEKDYGAMAEYPYHLNPDKFPNRVIILPIKSSWNREEFKKELSKLWNETPMSYTEETFDEWFDKKY